MVPLLTDRQLLTAIRAFLVAVLPVGVEVVKGQDNRVGVPKSKDFVVVTFMGRERQSTNRWAYDLDRNVRAVLQPTTVSIQVDIFGPNSAANVQVVSTLARDMFSYDNLRAQGVDAAILFASEPRQMAWIGGDQQYEDRWEVDLSVQANMVIEVPQDFADHAAITPVNVP